jgi:catechol 2,3-dioxygenase-like lactoylglutathione lyase family enzyme
LPGRRLFDLEGEALFKLGLNFHIIHMTGDLQALDDWYDDVFSVWQYMPEGYLELERRDASMAMIGDLSIEPLAPAFSVTDWASFPLGRFYERFGSRWHSLAWWVDEGHDELFGHLQDNGVRLLGVGGMQQQQDGPTGPLGANGPIFTHPRDTFTQLEFMSIAVMARAGRGNDPRTHPAYDVAWWSLHHPLQILMASHATIAVRDLDRAREMFVRLFGSEPVHEAERDGSPTRSAFFAINDLVVELAQPITNDSAMAADIEKNKDSLYSFTFKVRDLDAARAHLESKGVVIAEATADTLVCEPETTHGAPMSFTTWSIPGDHRLDWPDRRA